MKIDKILYSSHFVRSARKLPPEVREELYKREALFRADCFDHFLKTHKLHGRQKDHWSFSITQAYRVLFIFVDEHAVEFQDVGDHSIYQ